MSLPNGGYREDVIRTKVFENYIRDHIVSWFTWAQRNEMGVERMEDLVLVSGCTWVTSWAAAVSVDNSTEAEISLESRSSGASFVWSKIRGPIVYHNSHFDPVRFSGYIYSACTNFFFFVESKIRPRPRINASSSRVSEQNERSSGQTFVLQQNPFPMTATTAETMRYK